jgi:hypothetical protein
MQRADLPEIVVVHGDDQFETFEIVAVDAPRGAVQPVAAPGRGRPHAAVGRMSDVVAVRAGRIDVELGFAAGIGHEFAEYALGGGRSADVAHAYKQDGLHGRTIRRVAT